MSVVRARIERIVAARGFIVTAFLLALLLASSTAGLGEFGDEADNLVLGNLLRQGQHLYSELFSHHFPGAYYWVAAVQTLVGTSIIAIRVALACWQMGLLALTARLTRRSMALALLALAWSLLRVFYRGQMVLYSSLSGGCVVAAGALAWDLLDAQSPARSPGWLRASLLGLCGGLGTLINPLTIYPLGVALLMLAVKDWRRAAIAVGAAVGVVGVYALHLTAAGAWADFYRDALLFNTHIYSRYTPTDPQRLTTTIKAAATGLGILDGQWWRLTWRPEAGFGTGAFDRWAATGLVYRFAVLAVTASLACRRRWHEAAFVYLFAAATLATEDPNFRRQGFTLFALLCALELIFTGRDEVGRNRLQQRSWAAIRVATAAALVWACVYAGGFLVHHREALSYDRTFEQQIRQAEMISAQICDQATVKLAAYPDGRYLYLLSDLEPLGGYPYVWPWVADVAMPTLLKELAAPDTQAIVIIEHMVVWQQHDTRVYLAPLLELIESRYTPVGPGMYLSPAQDRACRSARRESTR